MFQEEFVTTLTPLNNMNEIYHWQNKPFIEVLPYQKAHKTNGPNITKKIRKNKRKRTTFTTEQLKVLEKTFASSKYLDGERRRDLSKVLGLAEKCLKVWFQNKRMKEKREVSESSDSMSEHYTDSMSPESQLGSPELNTQSNFANYNTDNVNYTYNIPQNNQDSSEPNHSTFHLELNQANFDTTFAQTSFYDNYGYPAQYYPYLKTDNNYNKEPNNGYYQYCPPQTWSSEGFDLSYLHI